MKQYNVTILLLLLALPVWAQRPNPPVLDTVSVNQEKGSVWLSWKPGGSGQVDGYYIFRYIYTSDQVLDSTWQKIDTVGANVTAYHDTTREHATLAAPGKHSARYRVAAFNEAAQSLMSEIHSTIYLRDIDFDACQGTNTLTWNAYSAWKSCSTIYRIYARKTGENKFRQVGAHQCSEGADTIFVHKYLESNTQYSYFIHAAHVDSGYSTSSNIQSVTTDMPRQPNRLKADYITVTDNGKMSMQFRLDPDAAVEAYHVQHTRTPSGAWNTQETLQAPGDPLNTTQGFSPFKKHYFRLMAVNSCGVEYKHTLALNNIVLQVQNAPDQDGLALLEWNAPAYWADSLVRYKIYRQNNKGNFEQMAQATATNYSWQAPAGRREAENCFYIIAQNPQKGFTSRSNTACASADAIMGMPNAFIPNSDNPANQEFKPQISFVESYTLQIYDRWGNVIFESRQPSKGWKGKVNGGNGAAEGVYIYKIRYTKNGNTKTASGSVTLIR